MPDRPKRVAAIHDLSGFGRCSLSVILPTLSVMGVQVCPVPTTVFSTHTGGLGSVEQRDLSDFTLPCLEHYRRLGLEFECVYSGFLSSQEQIDHCLKFFSTYQDALAVVDPVMGDHGRPYRTITPQMRSRLGELVRVADIITPNLTEACMLLKIPYFNEGLSRAQAKSLLVRLSELGPNYVVITGAPMASGSIANIGYDRQNNSFWYIDCDYVPVSYPGTGDLFASVLAGGVARGVPLFQAAQAAADFVRDCIARTLAEGLTEQDGVDFEPLLGQLTNSK